MAQHCIWPTKGRPGGTCGNPAAEGSDFCPGCIADVLAGKRSMVVARDAMRRADRRRAAANSAARFAAAADSWAAAAARRLW